jgi:hypothetical protein
VFKLAIPLHPANAALVAVVVISLGAIVKKIADGAKIGGELNAAIKTRLGHRLSVIALIAHHLFHGMPIHFMALGVVVTVTTHIRLVATRGH